MVPGAGLEPARSFLREILSLLCLPISPSGQKAGEAIAAVAVFVEAADFTAYPPQKQCLSAVLHLNQRFFLTSDVQRQQHQQ